MIRLGVQTQYAVADARPLEGFELLRRAGFSCADFSLHGYLLNTDIYRARLNDFFSRPFGELEAFFAPHREAAEAAGVEIFQMHMPYPLYVPMGTKALNAYLWREVAPKSLRLCRFMGCRYIVVHGFKLARYLGSEELEWEETERLLEALAPEAKALGVTLCLENLYDSVGGHLIEGPCCHAERMARRIDALNERYGAEVAGFCFDTGHANLVGLDMEAFLRTLGKRLKVLHVHDNDGMRDLHQIPFVFARTRENRSSTDWDGFLRGLAAIGFDGVLSFETSPVLTSFPHAMRADALGFVARVGAYFAGEIGRLRANADGV